jgi:hypothetical protein
LYLDRRKAKMLTNIGEIDILMPENIFLFSGDENSLA